MSLGLRMFIIKSMVILFTYIDNVIVCAKGA